MFELGGQDIFLSNMILTPLMEMCNFESVYSIVTHFTLICKISWIYLIVMYCVYMNMYVHYGNIWLVIFDHFYQPRHQH